MKQLKPEVNANYSGYFMAEPVANDNPAKWTGKKGTVISAKSTKYFIDLKAPVDQVGEVWVFSTKQLREAWREAKIGAFVFFTYKGQRHTGKFDIRGIEIAPHIWDAGFFNPEDFDQLKDDAA